MSVPSTTAPAVRAQQAVSPEPAAARTVTTQSTTSPAPAAPNTQTNHAQTPVPPNPQGSSPGQGVSNRGSQSFWQRLVEAWGFLTQVTWLQVAAKALWDLWQLCWDTISKVADILQIKSFFAPADQSPAGPEPESASAPATARSADQSAAAPRPHSAGPLRTPTKMPPELPAPIGDYFGTATPPSAPAAEGSPIGTGTADAPRSHSNPEAIHPTPAPGPHDGGGRNAVGATHPQTGGTAESGGGYGRKLLYGVDTMRESTPSTAGTAPPPPTGTSGNMADPAAADVHADGQLLAGLDSHEESGMETTPVDFALFSRLASPQLTGAERAAVVQELHARHAGDPEFALAMKLAESFWVGIDSTVSAFGTALLREQRQQNLRTMQQMLDALTHTVLTLQQQQEADLLRVADQLHRLPLQLRPSAQSSMEGVESAFSAFGTRLLHEQQQHNMQNMQQLWQTIARTTLTQQQQQQADLLRFSDHIHTFPLQLQSNLQTVGGQALLALEELSHQQQPESETGTGAGAAHVLPAAGSARLQLSAGASLPGTHFAARPPCNLPPRLITDIALGPAFDHHCSCGSIHKAVLVATPAAGAAGPANQQGQALGGLLRALVPLGA